MNKFTSTGEQYENDANNIEEIMDNFSNDASILEHNMAEMSDLILGMTSTITQSSNAIANDCQQCNRTYNRCQPDRRRNE